MFTYSVDASVVEEGGWHVQEQVATECQGDDVEDDAHDADTDARLAQVAGAEAVAHKQEHS